MTLPTGLLEFGIEIANPLADEEVADLLDRLDSGQPICGEAPFPSCDELPAILGGTACILSEDGVNFDCEGKPFAFLWGEDGFGDVAYGELLSNLGILGENLGEVGENLGNVGENLGGLLGGQDESSTETAPDDSSTDDSGDD